jgi:hypothetical protein
VTDENTEPLYQPTRSSEAVRNSEKAWRRGMMLVLDELAGDGNELLAPYLRVRRLRVALDQAKEEARKLREEAK